MSNSRVLVTGHTGFIGSALVKLLRERGNIVLGVSSSTGCLLEEPCSLDDIDGGSLTHVYHVAGRTFVPESWEHPGLFYRVNVLGTQTVLEFCRRYALPLIYVSAYVYGQPQNIPIQEEHPLCPDNPYAHSKVLAEELCRFYSDKFGISVTIVRPFNIFGPGQPERFLIPTIIRQALDNDIITLANTVSARDFVFVDDVADALIFLAEQHDKFAIYNICSGQSVSVSEVAEMVCGILGQTRELRSKEIYRPNEVLNVIGSNKKLSSAGWNPKYTFAQGLAAAVAAMNRGGNL